MKYSIHCPKDQARLERSISRLAEKLQQRIDSHNHMTVTPREDLIQKYNLIEFL